MSIQCDPYQALLTPLGCDANVQAALAAKLALEYGVPVLAIPDVQLDRLYRCRQCPIGQGLIGNEAGRLLTKAIEEELAVLTEYWKEFDWDYHDEEVTRERSRERSKRYRRTAAGKAKRARYMREYRQHKRETSMEV